MKKVKSVAFNVADPMEFKLYHYALKQAYFSTYVKRLIQRDMEGGHKLDGEGWEEAYEEFIRVNED